MLLTKITRPTLLIDREKCNRNIQKIADKVATTNAILRPHFKTHHSATIGDWYRDFGVNSCTVSSVAMAEYFVDHGWKDITIAFPFNPLEKEAINQLAKKAKINILIESTDAIKMANEVLNSAVGFYIKLDLGTHRTGLNPKNKKLIKSIIAESTPLVNYRGFIGHLGHTYGARSKEEILSTAKESHSVLLELRQDFGGQISFGDTPSCSVLEDLSDFDEIRAGNFIFYDLMQSNIGSCTVDEVAVCMACPVVAIHPDRGEVVLHGGAVHFSKDQLVINGEKTFGRAVNLTSNGWRTDPIGNMVRLSQEHGIVKMQENALKEIRIGDLIGVIPVHSCLTADLQGHYLSTEGHKIQKIIKN